MMVVVVVWVRLPVMRYSSPTWMSRSGYNSRTRVDLPTPECPTRMLVASAT
jgi:hypothetical protein